MAQAKFRAMLVGYVEKQKKDSNGKLRVNKDTNAPIMDRKASLLDLDSDSADIYRVNVPEDLVSQVKPLHHKNVEVIAEIGTFDGYTYFRMLRIVEFQAEKKAA